VGLGGEQGLIAVWPATLRSCGCLPCGLALRSAGQRPLATSSDKELLVLLPQGKRPGFTEGGALNEGQGTPLAALLGDLSSGGFVLC
jgi:hypothetical protein